VRFKVVIASRNSMPWLPRALASVARQTDEAVDVCVVDDASDDPRQAAFVERYATEHRWAHILNDRRRGALYNQYQAVRRLQPAPEDVIVFVDGDDRLASDGALTRLRGYYAPDVLMTYGSYICDPPDPRVMPAREFPEWVVAENAYRAFSARDDPDPIWFNHLRTVRYELFSRLEPALDFTFDDGTWFPVCCDTAVMVPCFEMAGGRYLHIPELLYAYTRNNPLSDCWTHGEEVERTHHHIFHVLTPKEPTLPIRRPARIQPEADPDHETVVRLRR
jgi:glycosyltransferase involved in cell wall biosynthesis